MSRLSQEMVDACFSAIANGHTRYGVDDNVLWQEEAERLLRAHIDWLEAHQTTDEPRSESAQ